MRETLEFIYAFGAAVMLTFLMKIEHARGFRRCTGTFFAIVAMVVLWFPALILTAIYHYPDLGSKQE